MTPLPPTTLAPNAGKLYDLQRTAGNTAVCRLIAAAKGPTVQTKPSDFRTGLVAHELNPGMVVFGTNWWRQVRERLDAYSRLDDRADHDTRRAILASLVRAVQDWEERDLASKVQSKLTETDVLRKGAVSQLRRSIRGEWGELGGHGGLPVGVGGRPPATPDPELTKKVTRTPGVGGGVFTQAVDIVGRDGAPVGRTTVGRVAMVIEDGTAPDGQQSEHYRKVRPDEKAAGSANYADFQEGWVPRAAVVEVERTERRADLEYADRIDPVTYPLFPHPPTLADVEQAGLGDCYFLAAVLAIVRDQPAYFQRQMRDNLDGTVTVRLFEVQPGPPRRFVEQDITVNKSVVVDRATQKPAFAAGALWVQILEKAYVAAGFYGSTARTLPLAAASYGIAEGGNSDVAFEHLLGTPGGRSPLATFGSGYSGGSGAWLLGPDLLRDLERVGTDAAAWSAIVFRIIGAFNDLHRSEVVRREEVIRFFDQHVRQNNIPANLRDTLVRHAEQIYPEKRGTGVYTSTQMQVFDSIRLLLDAKRYVAVGTKEKVVTAPPGPGQPRGHSGDEEMGKGLVGPHAYELIEYAPKEPVIGDVLWVKIRNPWRYYGRKYVAPHAGSAGGPPMDPSRPGAWPRHVRAVQDPAPEFWLELGDLTKRFSELYHGVSPEVARAERSAALIRELTT